MSTAKRPPYVQVLNPALNRWVKLSTRTGAVVAQKRTPGPYKNVPVRQPEAR